MKLSELYLRSAETGLNEQSDNGAMPPGQNGPHGDPETPVRNTSHWLILFLKAYEISSGQRFEKAAERCLNYLLSSEARPMGETFFHRYNRNKDFSNGVIGQAWTMEALICAYRHFERDELLKLAEGLFNLHPYNKEVQCWNVVNVDGSIRGLDRTFNHQLWFASIGCRLIKEGVDSVKDSTLHFINYLSENIETYQDGVIKHYPYGFSRPESIRRKAGRFAHNLKGSINHKDSRYSHSLGYHHFNTYALSVIHKCMPDLAFFQSEVFSRCIKVIGDSDYEQNMVKAKFGYPYNPPGIEAAISVQDVNFWPIVERRKIMGRWLQNQFDHSFDYDKFRMDKNTPDPATLQARLYELYNLNDFDFEILTD